MLSRIERGHRASPHFATVARISAIIGLSLDTVAFESGLPNSGGISLALTAGDRTSEKVRHAIILLDKVRHTLQSIERLEELQTDNDL